jgi:hypothetical protein
MKLRASKTNAVWALTRFMLFALAVYVAGCLIMIARDIDKRNHIWKSIEEAERRLLDVSHTTTAAMHAVQDVITGQRPVSDILAVIPTCKQDLDIARTSKLWRGETIQALFLLAEQEQLTAAEEAELAAEGATVRSACCCSSLTRRARLYCHTPWHLSHASASTHLGSQRLCGNATRPARYHTHGSPVTSHGTAHWHAPSQPS